MSVSVAAEEASPLLSLTGVQEMQGEDSGSVASAKAVLLCLSGRTVLRVVVMIVFVTQMLLMMAGDVEPNPGPGERAGMMGRAGRR